MSREAVCVHQMTNTHILLQDFTYVEPTSLQEVTALLRQYGERAQVLAGGTFLLVQMKMERQAPECVINIQKIPELEGFTLLHDALCIGARTSIRAVRDAPQVRAKYVALAEASAAFGSTQIQMMGTIGGNVCNGSPASDAVPALLALDARLLLTGPAGERVVPLEEFLIKPGRTAREEGEWLTSLLLPSPSRGTGSAFIKLARVTADLAKVSAAATLVRKGKRVIDCRLAFGSVGPKVLRTRGAEELLVGQKFSPELAMEAGIAASQEVTPIDDVRSTAWYRREVLKAVTHDVLCMAWERAAEKDDRRTQDKRGAGAEGALVSHPEPYTRDRDSRFTLHVPHSAHHQIELTVNGEKHQLGVAPNELLLNVLRDRLELTGTKYGCGIGECGACTVHLNGSPVLACLTLAIAADGSEVSTVEGMRAADGTLDPLQDAFIEHQAFQCGYCTPGMLLMSKSLLKEIPSPTEEEVREYLRGNRCRCTGFASIVRAVMSCAREKEG